VLRKRKAALLIGEYVSRFSSVSCNQTNRGFGNSSVAGIYDNSANRLRRLGK